MKHLSQIIAPVHKVWYCFTLALVMVAGTAPAQTAWAPEYPGATPIRLEGIGAEQGLPHRTVNALFQDHRGLIWLGTPAGLVKYDGYSFQTYQYLKADSISGERRPVNISVNAIAEGPEGDLWAGSFFKSSGKPLLLHFGREEEKLTPVLLEEDSFKLNNPVWDIHIHGGYIWLTEPFLYRIKLPEHPSAAKLQLERLEKGRRGLRAARFLNIYEDSNGRLWLPTWLGVQEWAPEADTFRFHALNLLPEGRQLPDCGYTHLAEAADGWYWAVPDIGDFILRFHPEKGSREVVKNDRRLGLHMAQSATGQLWFGSRPGLGAIDIFDPGSRAVRRAIPEVDGRLFLPNVRARSMLCDFSGNIWIGTENGPLLKYEPQRDQFHWLQYQAGKEAALSHNWVTDIAQDERGRYWISTYGGGLNRWDRQAGAFTHYRAQAGATDGPLIDHCLGLDIGEHGKVWFAEGFQVGSFDPVSGMFSHYHAGGGTAWAVLEDSENRLWLTKDTGGLRRYDPQTGEFIRVELANPADTTKALHLRLRNIYQDSRGDLWITTFEARNCGFLRVDPESEIVKIYDQPEANSFCEGHSGYLWIGTIDGLLRFDPKTATFKQYREEDGLPNNTVNAIQEDGAGRLWLATGNGLSCFDPEQESFRNYFQSDGLPANEFNTVSYKNERGELFFGGTFGLLYFHPDSIRDNITPPRLAFTGVDLFGEPVAIDENGPLKKHVSLSPQIRFAHWQNDLTIHYAALHFKNPEKNSYRIQLDNYDEGWRDVGHQNFASYTNLDPGRYTFRAKAANSDGVWNEKGIALDITIRPPWYWNGWSQALYLVLTIGLILGVYRFQLNRRLALAEAERLKELDSFKTRLYTNITHEFRTPLTVIQGMAGQIEGHEEEKEAIHRNSRNLLHLVNRMLGLSKIEAGKMELKLVQGDILPYLRYVTESFHSYALNRKVNLNFYSDAEEIVMDYDPDKVLEVLSNLLSNALKFTPEYGKVQVVVKKQEAEGKGQPAADNRQSANSAFLKLTVTDTGVGISSKRLPHIFDRFFQVETGNTRKAEGAGIGLALVKELVELMDGEIDVESEVGEGTSFRVMLPARREADAIDAGDAIDFMGSHTIPSIESAMASARRASIVSASSKYTLLLVEDNRDVMHYLTTCLSSSPSSPAEAERRRGGGSREGPYQLLYARNGREGIAQAREHIPDIIISDVMMPEVDGFELCKTLKQDERTSHIPIILLTARADMPSKVEGLEHGADAYLVKPFHKEELEVRLRKLIELRQKLQERYNQPEFQSEPATQREDAFVLKVKQHLLDNLDDDTFGIEELSEALHLSRVHLHRKLKALTGKPTSHFIRQVRLQEGYKLLKAGGLNVSEAAYRVGYKDPGYFSKLFAEMYGRPPSEV